MLIKTDVEGADRVIHNDEVYKVVGGIAFVPTEVGEELIKYPHYNQVTEAVEDEVLDALGAKEGPVAEAIRKALTARRDAEMAEIAAQNAENEANELLTKAKEVKAKANEARKSANDLTSKAELAEKEAAEIEKSEKEKK